MKIRALSFLAVLLLLAGPAQAVTIYSYVGDTFHTVGGSYTFADRISGSFTVADGFTPPHTRIPDFTPGVISYSFTDGHQTLTEANSTGTFLLNIVDYPLGPPGWASVIRMETLSAGGWIHLMWDGGGSDGSDSAHGLDGGGLNVCCYSPRDGSTRGTWAVAVPEPASLVLVLTGLSALGLARWRAGRAGRARRG